MAQQQSWNAEQYAENGRFVANLAGEVFSWLEPRPGERILDLGCGDGALTAQIAASGATVIGVDASESMVQAARQRGLDAREVAGQELPFRGEFDAVFSNAALHWMSHPDAVLQGVFRALKPGGRFVAEMGGHGNIAAISVALSAVCAQKGLAHLSRETNYFPSVESYRQRLEASGFQVETIVLQPRPTLLPATGMEGWLRTFRRGVLEQISPQDREAVVQETVALLAPVLRDEQNRWYADYVRLRFCARRPKR